MLLYVEVFFPLRVIGSEGTCSSKDCATILSNENIPRNPGICSIRLSYQRIRITRSMITRCKVHQRFPIPIAPTERSVSKGSRRSKLGSCVAESHQGLRRSNLTWSPAKPRLDFLCMRSIGHCFVLVDNLLVPLFALLRFISYLYMIRHFGNCLWSCCTPRCVTEVLLIVRDSRFLTEAI